MPHVPPGPHEAYRAHRRWVRAGQVAMGLALVIAGVHVVAHLTASPSGLTDLVAGYPAAGVLFLVGAMLAGRADPAAR
ncbi:MAG: hypothetical protein ABIU87_01540 [Ornithinibacter sp.]